MSIAGRASSKGGVGGAKQLFLKVAFAALLGLLAAPSFAKKSDDVSVVTIERADTSEYKKNEDTGEDEIYLSGNVSLVVEKEDSKTRIRADFISYNRATQMLYAKGNIEMSTTDSDEGQTISAETILLNTSTLEGVFDGGRAVSLGDGSDASTSTMIVASRIFGQDSSGTAAFKKATLTFCDDENPHWKIKASRIWLLPGGEFAFLNALVYVGSVPVFYLPALYYPKDEVLFNPVFGYDERLGYYTQTTTYIIGRKPLEEDDEDDTGLSLAKPDKLKEQRREGLILHNLGADYTGDTTNYFKIMADYYSKIGLMVGASEVYKPKNEYVESVETTVQLGFTNTIFYTSSGIYTPYSEEGGELYKDGANFLGVETPFRYGGQFSLSVKKPFTLAVSIPIYSDPYFTEDFETRSEYLDWIKFLLGSTASGEDEDDDEDTSAQTDDFDWTAKLTYTVPLPYFVKPFVSKVAFTEVYADVSFDSVDRGDDDFLAASSEWQTFTPERSFFYPSQVVPIKISMSIQGTIFQYPFERSYEEFDSPKFPVALSVPDELKTQKQRDEDEKKAKKAELDAAVAAGEMTQEEADALLAGDQESKEEEEESPITFDMPAIAYSRTASITEVNEIDYALTYSITPKFTSQFNYTSSGLDSPEDFAWTDLYSTYYQMKASTTLSSDFYFKKPFLYASNTLSFDPVYQRHPSLDGYTSDSSKASVKKTDYKARQLDVTSTNALTVKPLTYTDVFRESKIVWNSTVNVIDTEFIGDADNPEWEYAVADLTDEESVTTHTVSATLAASEATDYSQSLTLTSNLPPQLDEYTLTSKLTFPHLTLSAEVGIEQESEDSDEFVWNPFKQSATLKFFDGDLAITESYNFELEEWYASSFKLSATWKNLQIAYVMQYTTPYDFDDEEGWVAQSEKDFIPYTLSLAYTTTSKNFRYWKRRITWAPALTASIVYDFVQPTDSYFRFVPSMTFRINEVFDLTFSAESQNNVIFRYFQRYTKYDGILSGEENMFVDLWNSFVFWGEDSFYDSDQVKRKSSGFKLKSLKISITRALHDWDMTGSLSFKPRAVTASDGTKYYDYHPYITFAISWHPMPSFKTELIDEYGEWELQ